MVGEIINKKKLRTKIEDVYQTVEMLVEGLRMDGYITMDDVQTILKGFRQNRSRMYELILRRKKNAGNEEEIVKYVLSCEPKGENLEEAAHEVYTNGRPLGKTFEELGYTEGWVYLIMNDAINVIIKQFEEKDWKK